MKNPVEGFSAGLVDDSNVFEWQVTIMGPPDTYYEGGFFNAIMKFSEDYPNKPPECRFTSEMWHPNGEEKRGARAGTDGADSLVGGGGSGGTVLT
jgi:ubiquitin-protein ligase